MRTAITTVLLTLASASKLGQAATPATTNTAVATPTPSASGNESESELMDADYTNFDNIDTQVE